MRKKTFFGLCVALTMLSTPALPFILTASEFGLRSNTPLNTPIPPYFAPIRVTIIDSGLDLKDPRFKNVLCKTGHKDFTHLGLSDTMGHGTHVAGLIKQYAGTSGYCLVIYKVFDPSLPTIKINLTAALREVAKSTTIVNFSGGGSERSEAEFRAVFELSHRGTVLVFAAGNDGQDLNVAPYYPASYDLGSVVVGCLGKNGFPSRISNYGSKITQWEFGTNIRSTFPNGKYEILSGTSMSTAITTGKIVHRMLHGY